LDRIRHLYQEKFETSESDLRRALLETMRPESQIAAFVERYSHYRYHPSLDTGGDLTQNRDLKNC
jgi:hypothetical protein